MSIATETRAEVEQAPLDSLYEVIDGRRVEKPPMAADAVWIASVLVRILGGFAHANQLGRVVAEMLFNLGAGRRQRRPDAAFVSYPRWPRERPITKDDAWEVVPDLAIEVISPSNTAGAMQRKVREYFEAGVRRVWVIYPEEHLIQVYSSPREVRGLGDGDELDGEDILPGFRLPVAELFQDIAPVE
jgi:Uma2 family endonuclease